MKDLLSQLLFKAARSPGEKFSTDVLISKNLW